MSETESDRNSRFVRYAITVALVSMAIGNIFVSKRLKHLKFKIPWSDSQKKSSSTTSSSSSESSNSYSPSPKLLDPQLIKSLNKLGLSITPPPTSSQVKQAYHKLALKHHPDTLLHANSSKKDEASRRFNELNEAYQYCINNDDIK